MACDALIVGGGITGSLIAERLTRQNLNVVIIDREPPGRGSTAASTSMLLWEIDRSLAQLTETYGFERASRAYLASLHAVAGLKSLVLQLGVACEMRDKDSLYLAADDTNKELLDEHRLRQRAGLPGDFLDHRTLLDIYGIARAGAIVSPGAADADPMQLARGLLRVAVARGARVFNAEAVEFDAAARSVGVQLTNGRQIEARSVILATGYVMPAIIHSTVQTISSSWAIATRPQPQKVWKDGALIWEGLSLCENDVGRTYHHRRRRQRRNHRARCARSPDPGEIAGAGTKTRRAVAGRGCRHRIPLVRNVRYHARRAALDRSGAQRERHLRRLWLWRQRDHLQFSRRAADRRSDRGIEFAAPDRFRAGPGWRTDHRVMDCLADAGTRRFAAGYLRMLSSHPHA